WLEQLAPGGLVLAPLDLAPGLAYLVRGTAQEGAFEGRLVRPAYFMPLRGEGETGRARGGASGLLPDPERVAAVPAPRGGWIEGRPPLGASFQAGLAFLGWLEGRTVAYVQFPEGRATHGVADLVKGHACWLGRREWRVTGQSGYELGRRLWQTFL